MIIGHALIRRENAGIRPQAGKCANHIHHCTVRRGTSKFIAEDLFLIAWSTMRSANSGSVSSQRGTIERTIITASRHDSTRAGSEAPRNVETASAAVGEI